MPCDPSTLAGQAACLNCIPAGMQDAVIISLLCQIRDSGGGGGGSALEPGMILLWSGIVDTIPSGYHLCDGTVGTPDLRNLFVVGAGTTYVPGNTDPGPTHAHEIILDSFVTEFPIETAIQAQAATDTPIDVPPAQHTHQAPNAGGVQTGPSTALPPYYALAYIMKL